MSATFLPRPLLYLTGSSLLLCLIIFILALFNFGVISVFINIVAAILTILHHGTVLVIAWRKAPAVTPDSYCPKVTYTVASITWSFFMCFIWIVAFGITAEATVNGPGSLSPAERFADWNVAVQIADAVLIALETAVLGAIAMHCLMVKKRADDECNQVDDEKFFYDNTSNTLVSSPTIRRSE